MQGFLIGTILLTILIVLTIYHYLKKEWKWAIIHTSIIIITSVIYNSTIPEKIPEIFKADKVLSAYNNEGLGSINIILRENGTFEYITFDFLANHEQLIGKYSIENDTLYLESDKDILSTKYYFRKEYLSYFDDSNLNHRFEVTIFDTNYFDK